MPDHEQLIDELFERSRDEDPKLVKSLEKLTGDDRAVLGQVLARFDREHTGQLGDDGVVLAGRVLSKFHTPSGKGLTLLLQALDYLDVDGNKVLDHAELTLAVDVLEMFCRADSVNDTLSAKELEMLIAVLERLDADGNGTLDPGERRALRDGLWDPNEFLEQEKQRNEKLRKLL